MKILIKEHIAHWEGYGFLSDMNNNIIKEH